MPQARPVGRGGSGAEVHRARFWIVLARGVTTRHVVRTDGANRQTIGGQNISIAEGLVISDIVSLASVRRAAHSGVGGQLD
jgi:hypothetical protein